MKVPLSDLRVRVLLLVMLALLPAFILTLYNAAKERSRLTQYTRNEALHFARTARDEHSRLTEGARQLLVALAQVPEVRNMVSSDCQPFLVNLLKYYPGYATFGVIDKTGLVRCSSIPTSGSLNLGFRSYFRDAMTSRTFAGGRFQTGLITKKPTMNYGYPILDDQGNPKGVVFVAIGVSWMERLTKTARLPAGSNIVIVDDNGDMLVRYPDPEKYSGRNLRELEGITTPALVFRDPEGTIELVGFDGIKRLYGFTPLHMEGQQTYCGVGIPIAGITAQIRQGLMRNLLGLAFVAALASLGAWMGGKYFIMRQVSSMLQSARRLTIGDIRHRGDLKTDKHVETIYLAQAVDELAKLVDQRQDIDLKVLDEVPVGVIVCDAHDNIIVMNRLARKWHGLDERKLPPEKWAEQYDILTADGSSFLPEEDHPLYRTMKGHAVSDFEFIVRYPSGATRRLLANGRPLRGERGEKLASVVVLTDLGQVLPPSHPLVDDKPEV